MPDGLRREKNRKNNFSIWSHVIFFNKTINKIYVEGIGMVYEQTEILENIRSLYIIIYNYIKVQSQI